MKNNLVLAIVICAGVASLFFKNKNNDLTKTNNSIDFKKSISIRIRSTPGPITDKEAKEAASYYVRKFSGGERYQRQ